LRRSARVAAWRIVPPGAVATGVPPRNHVVPHLARLVLDSDLMISASSVTSVRPPLAPRMADHPRFLESVAGRLLELIVYSVEGVRARLDRADRTAW
jgi:hypothetical protein